MFPFLSLLLLLMAVSFSSARSNKGKALMEAPYLLEHLPKSAHPLASSLSDDDREVLAYMLAFGVYVQMLVPPSAKFPWKPWKTSSAKVRDTAGFKHGHVLHSHNSQSMSAKSPEMGTKKASMHKPTSVCYCFSCYSSFWSRWTASPYRDDLNKIIEIVESQEENPSASADGKVKKQEKKRAPEKEIGCKKGRGGKWKLQATKNSSTSSHAAGDIVEASSFTHSTDDSILFTTLDDIDDDPWTNVIKAEISSPLFIADGSLTRTEAEELLSMVANCKGTLPQRIEINESRRGTAIRNASMPSEAHLRMQATLSATKEDELDGNGAVQASSSKMGGLLLISTQSKNVKHQRSGKHKSNQITPLDCEGSLIVVEEDQEFGVSIECSEGSASPRLVDANLRGRGFLSRVFPDALSDIASRLWDLISKSRSRTVDYY